MAEPRFSIIPADAEPFNPVEYSCGLKLPPTPSLIMMLLEATAHGVVHFTSVAAILDRVGCSKKAFKRAIKLVEDVGAATFSNEGDLLVARFNGHVVSLVPPESEVRDDPWQVMRARVFASKGCACAYCGRPASHVDHQTPRSRGGSDHIDNLVPSCARCNILKGSRTVSEWRGSQ